MSKDNNTTPTAAPPSEGTEMTTTSPLILTGEGYGLIVPPEALQLRDSLLAASAAVVAVRDNEESGAAQFVGRKLAALRIAVEKSRTEIKKPVLEIGKRIDAEAKGFVAKVEAEENRIRKLVGDHAAEVEKQRRAAEEAERRAAEEARRAREEAERAAAAAAEVREAKASVAEIAAARAAEREAEAQRQAALAERMAAAERTHEARVADGVRFVWDFEVVNAERLYASEPELVALEPRRSEIAARIKGVAERFDDEDVIDTFKAIGVRAFKKAVMSSR